MFNISQILDGLGFSHGSELASIVALIVILFFHFKSKGYTLFNGRTKAIETKIDTMGLDIKTVEKEVKELINKQDDHSREFLKYKGEVGIEIAEVKSDVKHILTK